MEENLITEKSYNPFKMWGSWVGLILITFLLNDAVGLLSFIVIIGLASVGMGFLIGWGIHSLILRLRKKDKKSKKKISYNPLEMIGSWIGAGIFSLAFIKFLLIPILGFLLGWGIHSLIRRLKK